ncbi:MAG TPA: hypothetical protein VFD70_04800 [Anaerolineae bacterium]|nr:hypothetical protein [Anaerolineae bacterium]
MKLICAYDTKEDTFAILSHNLSDTDAEQQLREMRSAKIPAYTLDQPRTHNSMDPDQCASCVRLVLKTIKPKTPVRSQDNQTARTRIPKRRPTRRK